MCHNNYMRLVVTILLNILIAGLVLICVFLGYTVYRSYQNEGVPLSTYVQPNYLLSIVQFNREEKWVTYESSTFSFEHPESWSPKQLQGNNTLGEAVDLRVPIVFNLPRVGDDTIIGYYRNPVLNKRPAKIESETEFVFADRRGYKWIYKTEDNFYAYEYIIPVQSEVSLQQAVMSFFIRVEVIKKDDRMEKLLDRVAESVQFKQF